MKCYIQNGHNKRVLSAGNFQQASIKVLKNLIKPNSSGDELAELSPIIMASQCGFMHDILQANMQKEFDEIKLFSTAKLFAKMGRKDISKFLRKQEDAMPSQTKKLVKSL